MGSIASALGKWSALNGEDAVPPAFCHHMGAVPLRAACREADAKAFRRACLDAILCSNEGGVQAVLGARLAAADVGTVGVRPRIWSVAACRSRSAFSCERRVLLQEAGRLARTALVEVEPN